MSWTEAAIDWWARNKQYYDLKFRTPRKAPPYISAEIGDDIGVSSDIWASWDEEKQQRIAAQISWIYANINRIGSEVSSAQFHMFEKGTNKKDIEHPLERLMAFPNEFFDGISLLRHTIWGLSLDKWGAFWFIAPDRRTGQPREIWPIPIGRLRPVKDKNKFISHYVYTARNGDKVPIRKEFIVWFLYANPFDIYQSITPLSAAALEMNVYEGIATAQRDTFTKSRGVPLSVLSLDTNIGETDFSIARQRIREDWDNERSVAVVRAGSLDVKTVGLSSGDLQVIASAEFSRDTLDAIFMNGIQWHSIGGTDDRDAISKEIKEVVIYPLHKLITARMQIDLITPWYGEEFFGEFDDVRAQDRSISLQENTIYFHSMTVDETRSELGLQGFKNPDFPDYGKLPYSLARNAAFVSEYYEIGVVPDRGELPEGVGNLPDVLDPEREVEEQTGTETMDDSEKSILAIDVGEAATDGVKQELKRYRRVLLRTYRKTELAEDLVNRVFDSDIIFPEVMDSIKAQLSGVNSEGDIKDIFAPWIADD